MNGIAHKSRQNITVFAQLIKLTIFIATR